MSDASSGVASRAAELRRIFDRSFSEPRHSDTASTEDFLAIRLGLEPYAIRLSEITGLFADKRLTRVPGRVAALLGIAGFRGAIMPVYDLRMLLGYPQSEGPRWLVTASAMPVAFAFDAFDGHVRVPQELIAQQEASEHSRGPVREFLRNQEPARPVVSLASVLDAIGDPTEKAVPSEERRP